MIPVYLNELIELSGWDPSQPRVPGGDPDGGQWTDDASHTGDWKPKGERPKVVDIPRTGDGMGHLRFDPIKGDGYEITPARYAKGKALVRVKDNAGYLTSAGTIADILAHGHVGYSNREKGYIMSPATAEKFQKYVIEGWHGNQFTREIRPPEKRAA